MNSPSVVLVHIVDDCGNVMEKKKKKKKREREKVREFTYVVCNCDPCRKYGKNEKEKNVVETALFNK